MGLAGESRILDRVPGSLQGVVHPEPSGQGVPFDDNLACGA